MDYLTGIPESGRGYHYPEAQNGNERLPGAVRITGTQHTLPRTRSELGAGPTAPAPQGRTRGAASLTSYKPCCFPGLRRGLTLHVGLAISSKGSHLGQTVSLTVQLVGLGLGEDLVIFSQLSSTLAMSTDQAL